MSVSQGLWKPRKVANPAFFEDLHPFRMNPFSAVGLELWSMSSDIFFDNFFITNDRVTADRWATDGWGLKKAAEGAAEVRERAHTYTYTLVHTQTHALCIYTQLTKTCF